MIFQHQPTSLSYILASTHLSRENLALMTNCLAVARKIEKEFYFIPGALSNMILAKYRYTSLYNLLVAQDD